MALSASRGVYDQLRWIDEAGIERVRVDYVQNQPFVVPDDRLQNKAQRYYFVATMGLARGAIYVSPLDLNVEQERIETPHKPMIRLGTPVQDRFGNPRGIIIANFFGSYLLERFSEATDSKDGAVRVSLLNRDGYWPRAPQTDEWGLAFGRKDNFATRFPQAWKQIGGAERGQFEDGDGLWSFVTVRPLQVGMTRMATGGTLMADDGYVWKVVSRIPAETLRRLASRTSAGGS